jgi:hypothetical protein
MTDNTVKALGRAYGIMAAQLPDIIGAHCRVQTANMWPIRGLGEGLRYMIINRKLTPDVDRAIRDALQGAEDITEGEHALPLNQQGIWELAYMQGRCAPVLSDGEYLRDQLKAKGLTMEQAAEACEVSKAAVHSWCAGVKPIPQARRELLAAKFGIMI